MLSKAGNEDKTVRTVTLARGSLAKPGTPTTPSRPNARSRYSSDQYSTSRKSSGSPDTYDQQDLSQLLGNIGFVELLDNDPRPSFLLDLSDSKNIHSDGLHLLYANAAFRQLSSHVDGETKRSSRTIRLDPCFENLPAVKTWIYGRAQPDNSSPKYASALLDGEVLWSCTFLRRRFAVVSGILQSTLAESQEISTSNTAQSPALTIDAAGTEPVAPKHPFSTAADPLPDQHDYFGSTTTGVGISTDQLSQQKSSSAGAKSDLSSHQSLKSEATRRSHGSALDVFSDSYPAEQVLSAACAGNVDFQYNPSGKDVGFFDWTRLPVSDALPKHIQFARSVDWGATALGPIESWSADLRQMCNLIMASPHPAAMYWGEDLVAIYNEAYVLLAGQKHPTLMGQSYREAWKEIWDEVKDVFASAQTTGQATMKDDDCLFIRRNDFLEETYFSWSIIPMVGGDGSVMGLYNPAFEKTRRKIAERRMLTLREIGERTAAARDVKSFWEEVLAALECNEYDVRLKQ